MKRVIISLCFFVLFASTVFAGPAIDRETIYQGSTIEALLAGNYDGVATVQKVKSQGDMGLGTFSGLDGEMIVLDGKVYKAAKDGKVTEEKDNVQTPFYAVKFFAPDITKKLQSEGLTLSSLKTELDQLRKRNDLPYAIIIKGKFKAVKVRSVGPYDPPYPLLSEAINEQSVFDYSEISGRLVGFWLPAYMGNTNAAGYHLHFLSDDSQKGGHVLDLTVTDAEINLDETPNFHIEFSPYPTKPLEKPDSYKS
ncbi:MAG TPA: acetolactate decarboxylase [Patescibacteria group bacterium]|nr:acetolactate decarboxylase [Patescibacteria group bacterium]